MKNKNSGTFVFVSSSGAAPLWGHMKYSKQLEDELWNTLFGELENTNINVYSIGPGLVERQKQQ